MIGGIVTQSVHNCAQLEMGKTEAKLQPNFNLSIHFIQVKNEQAKKMFLILNT